MTGKDIQAMLLQNDKQRFAGRVGALKAMRKYIDDHYTNVHPRKMKLNDLQALKRNVKRWRVQIDSQFENGGNSYGKQAKTEFYAREQSEVQKLNIFIERFFEAVELDIQRLKGQVPNGSPESAINAIDEAKRQTFLRWETLLSKQVQNWQNGQDKEQCTAFLKYVARKDFLPDKPKTLKVFALNRYQLKINSTLDKLNRNNNKDLLTKKINEVVRIIQNKPYGKVSTE